MFMGHFNNAKRVTLKCKKKKNLFNFLTQLLVLIFPNFTV